MTACWKEMMAILEGPAARVSVPAGIGADGGSAAACAWAPRVSAMEPAPMVDASMQIRESERFIGITNSFKIFRSGLPGLLTEAGLCFRASSRSCSHIRRRGYCPGQWRVCMEMTRTEAFFGDCENYRCAPEQRQRSALPDCRGLKIGLGTPIEPVLSLSQGWAPFFCGARYPPKCKNHNLFRVRPGESKTSPPLERGAHSQAEGLSRLAELQI